jgi:cytochrome c5
MWLGFFIFETRMKKYSVFIIVGLIALSGCFGAKKVVEAKSSEESALSKAQAKFPGYTLEQFEDGKNLYETNCNKCHALKTPKNYSEEEWAKLVPSMSKKANDKKGSDLTEEDQILIYNYVIAASL